MQEDASLTRSPLTAASLFANLIDDKNLKRDLESVQAKGFTKNMSDQ